ncbi:MAG TPA: hypothetical protein IAA56_06825 [Candidatus Galloscillospira excrementavium]|nr:hypothetical protein [Candidatus Galloscillospira excrementavium]
MKKHRSRFLSGLLVVAMVAALAIPAAAEMVQLNATTGVTIYVDDQKVDPRNSQGDQVDALLTGGTTYLPIRALGDALGKDIGWDESTTTAYVSGYEADPKAAEYLEEYFDIAPLSGTVSRAAFDAALEAIGGSATEGTGDLTVADAVVAAVKAAGLDELAQTYTRDNNAKANERIAAYGLPAMEGEAAAYVAAALDSDLAYATFDFDAALDAETANTLLMNAVNISGQGRRYLGRASDSDIYSKLQAAWDSFGNFDDPVLSSLGEQLVLQQASTGYNLKFDGYNANFLSEYTLQYGHSDITHAVQLIALLNSEGIDALIQLEPKTSIYEYMVEWGDPTQVESTPTYELRQIEGTDRWLCYATEYDMKLEFDSIEDKNAFDGIVNEYAKKWIANENEDGSFTPSLLAGAWWQPLYTSTVPMADTEAYTLIQDNVIHNGAYSIHPFSLAGNNAEIVRVVSEEAPDLSVDVVDLYVNMAFFRYLNGDDSE